MARGPRIHYPGAVYHVTSRGVDGLEIFPTDREKNWFFLEILSSIRDGAAQLLSYCVMTTHFHLLLQVADIPLPAIVQPALSRFAARFNFDRGRSGHVFQGRYTPKLVETPDYLRELITYIHANPVRAGIVASMTDWPWSSCRELISGAASQLVNRQELLDLAELDMEGLRDLLAQPVEKRERTPLWELANDAASIWGIDPRQIREGGKRATAYCTKARIRLIEEALDAGYSRAEISRFLNCSRAAVSKLGRKC